MDRPMMMPGLRRIRRDRNTVQLGVDPRHAVVIEYVHPATVAVLALLDGRHTETEITRCAVAAGGCAEEVHSLLTALRARRLVLPSADLCPEWLPEPTRRRLRGELATLAWRGATRPEDKPPGPAQILRRQTGPEDNPPGPAQILRRRAAAKVLITGASLLVLPTATALAGAGIGALHTVSAGRVDRLDAALTALPPSDLGRARSTVAIEALRRGAPGARTHPFPQAEATIVVRFGPARPVALDVLAWRRGGPAVLGAVVREGSVVIGPLLRPAGSPCPSCLELHRRDRDPAWPAVAAQVTTTPGGEEPCAVTTVLAAVGWLAAEVLAHVDGLPPYTGNAMIEVDGPHAVRRRSWSAHPDCACAGRVLGGRQDSQADDRANQSQ